MPFGDLAYTRVVEPQDHKRHDQQHKHRGGPHRAPTAHPFPQRADHGNDSGYGNGLSEIGEREECGRARKRSLSKHLVFDN